MKNGLISVVGRVRLVVGHHVVAVKTGVQSSHLTFVSFFFVLPINVYQRCNSWHHNDSIVVRISNIPLRTRHSYDDTLCAFPSFLYRSAVLPEKSSNTLTALSPQYIPFFPPVAHRTSNSIPPFPRAPFSIHAEASQAPPAAPYCIQCSSMLLVRNFGNMQRLSTELQCSPCA